MENAQMTTTIPYLLDPSVYAEQLISRGVSLSGFIQHWKEGKLPLFDSDYIADVVIEWVRLLPLD